MGRLATRGTSQAATCATGAAFQRVVLLGDDVAGAKLRRLVRRLLSPGPVLAVTLEDGDGVLLVVALVRVRQLDDWVHRERGPQLVPDALGNGVLVMAVRARDL